MIHQAQYTHIDRDSRVQMMMQELIHVPCRSLQENWTELDTNICTIVSLFQNGLKYTEWYLNLSMLL